MKIAIIGTGIAGNLAAQRLALSTHDGVRSRRALGGHTNTNDVAMTRSKFAMDTGFIVYNDWTYPNFIALLDELGAASTPTEMSFSGRCENAASNTTAPR